MAKETRAVDRHFLPSLISRCLKTLGEICWSKISSRSFWLVPKSLFDVILGSSFMRLGELKSCFLKGFAFSERKLMLTL